MAVEELQKAQAEELTQRRRAEEAERKLKLHIAKLQGGNAAVGLRVSHPEYTLQVCVAHE